MSQLSIYETVLKKKQEKKKQLAVLLDPDKLRGDNVSIVLEKANEASVDYLFVGSSLLLSTTFDEFILKVKASSAIPLILFPGNSFQLSNKADGILFLSLISGRNPDLLIGQHVISAPFLKQSSLEILSTGYVLVDGGNRTGVSYMSGTHPIPHDQDDIAACTALAGEMLGFKLIYLEAGSGAKWPISSTMIRKVNSFINVPLIVGGGIKSKENALEACQAGADIIVMGNALEKHPDLISSVSEAVHNFRFSFSV